MMDRKEVIMENKSGVIEHGAVDHQRIVERAQQKFRARGGHHGRDIDDWLEAEAELRAAPQAGHGSEYAPTARATELEAQRHANEAKAGHLVAGVDGRRKAIDIEPMMASDKKRQ